jgi:hypothetical protein
VGGTNGIMLVTTDSGTTWEEIDSGVTENDTLLSIDGIDAMNVIIGTLDGDVVTTTDSGINTESTALGSGTINGVSYFNNETRFAVGNQEGSSTIWKFDSEPPSRPTGFEIVEGNPAATSAPTFIWDASTDNVGVANYYLNVDDGEVLVITTMTEAPAEDLADGDHTITLSAFDEAGNESERVVMNFTIDTTDPIVSPIAQTEAVTGGTWFTATANDATTGIASCDLVVNGFTVGAMSHSGGDTYSLLYGLVTPGVYSIFVACLDEVNNATSSTVTNVNVTVGAEEESLITEGEGADAIDMGNLIKTPCSLGADINDPCKAVYWYGDDGMRHAFTNDKSYFTWFADFDGVVLATTELMASIPLGPNVTYKPGVQMIKFPSLNTVYAVGSAGELRAVGGEDVATDLFGANWNTMIDDVSEAFYFNYSFGADILEAGDYIITDALTAMTTPDDLF